MNPLVQFYTPNNPIRQALSSIKTESSREIWWASSSHPTGKPSGGLLVPRGGEAASPPRCRRAPRNHPNACSQASTYLVRPGHRLPDSPGLDFCACPRGGTGFPLLGERWRAGDVAAAGDICGRHRVWAGSGGVENGAAAPPG